MPVGFYQRTGFALHSIRSERFLTYKMPKHTGGNLILMIVILCLFVYFNFKWPLPSIQEESSQIRKGWFLPNKDSRLSHQMHLQFIFYIKRYLVDHN